MTKSPVYLSIAIVATVAVVTPCLYYPLQTGNYDESTFLVSVVLPIVLGSAIMGATRNRILLFAFLAYIFAVLDDAPVFLDSVLTWPEVTRFHPFLPRLFMNIVIHGLTILFFYLSARAATRGARVRLSEATGVMVLAFIAFVLAYAQNIPLSPIQNLVDTSWFQFDLAEKVASIIVFSLAIREALKLGRAGTPRPG